MGTKRRAFNTAEDALEIRIGDDEVESVNTDENRCSSVALLQAPAVGASILETLPPAGRSSLGRVEVNMAPLVEQRKVTNATFGDHLRKVSKFLSVGVTTAPVD